MRALAPIFVVVAALAAVPLVVSSNVVLNFLVVTLLIALAGQGWNILGGYGGQYSFGHAAFFGTGAYVTAIVQMRYGINAWLGFAIGIATNAPSTGLPWTPVYLAGDHHGPDDAGHFVGQRDRCELFWLARQQSQEPRRDATPFGPLDDRGGAEHEQPA